jgi:uncharacterized protein
MVAYHFKGVFLMFGWFLRAAVVAFASLSMISACSAANTKAQNSAKAHLPIIKDHRLLIQVDQNDPAVMNLALNNATNVIEYYRAKGQDVNVDIVTYGPGCVPTPRPSRTASKI